MPQDIRVAGRDVVHVSEGSAEPDGGSRPHGGLLFSPVGGLAQVVGKLAVGGVQARDSREHQRAAVSGLSAVIDGSLGAAAGRHRVLNVGERGMLIDGLVRPVGDRISFVLAGRGIDRAGCGRVAHRRGRSAGVAVDHWDGAPETIRALLRDGGEPGAQAEAYISDWS